MNDLEEYETFETAGTQHKKTGAYKLVIILLAAVIILLGSALGLLHFKEQQDTAKALNNAREAQTAYLKSKTAYLSISNSGEVEPPSIAKALSQALAAETLFEEKKYDAAKVKFAEVKDLYSKAAATLTEFNKHMDSLNETETALRIFETLDTSFPELKEPALKTLDERSKKSKSLLMAFDFENASKEIEAYKTEFTNIETELKNKENELEKQWQNAKKDNTKESYQVFLSTFPNSAYKEEAGALINEIIEADKAAQEAEALAKKIREEALKKEQEIVAARKAAQEEELKIKRQLEQVVTLNFEDGSSYTGQLNLEKKPHGEGTFSYTNSNVYRGKWNNGLYEGEGTYEFYTGVVFTGEWKDGKRHGKGLLSWKNGDRFAGTWVNGVLNGDAVWAPKKDLKKSLVFHNGEYIGRLTPEAFQKQKELMEERFQKNRLSTNQKRSYEFQKRYNNALSLLYKENPDILFPDLRPYSYDKESYLDGRMGSRQSDTFEAELKTGFFELKRYLMVTKDSLEKDEVGNMQSAEFGGYTIMTANLGVILDNSGSMTQYLPKLRKKIQEKFAKSAFIEVSGCSLYPTQKGVEINEMNAMSNTLSAIKFLVDKKGVDTIYWFSDLNDPQQKEALEELREFFYKNLVTFYISSVGHKPGKELKDIIDESGGKVLKN